jgi:alanyl-tRNA synthetase
LSGKKYASTLPNQGSTGETEQEKIDVAFRVIADHIRTLSFAIADGIQPGNTDRNYVLRRILRRAVRYGRSLGFHEPFFYKLVDVLAQTMGDVFPEIRAKKKYVQDAVRGEEEAFNRTLDEGLRIFDEIIRQQVELSKSIRANLPKLDDLQNQSRKFADVKPVNRASINEVVGNFTDLYAEFVMSMLGANINYKKTAPRGVATLVTPFVELTELLKPLEGALKILKDPSSPEDLYFSSLSNLDSIFEKTRRDLIALRDRAVRIDGPAAFSLYDTYGFPLDLTELIARDRGLKVDVAGFNKLMEEQKARARASQKKEVISISQIETSTPTKFVGYENRESPARVIEVVGVTDKTAVILDTSACYAEMGGQVGDTGEIEQGGQLWRITNTQKNGNTWLHLISDKDAPAVGAEVVVSVDTSRRHAIERHHTVTHLLHWALHEVVSKEASQKGSFVGPEKLTFDFNSPALTPQQVVDVEKLVNERIVENAGVSWKEFPYAEVKNRKDVMQFFGDKYGDSVRIVQVGGTPGALDGYSMELCGGTHTRATGEIGLFRIVGENAIAAGVRRIEAVAGLTAYDAVKADRELIKSVAGKVNSPVHELEKKIESLLAHQKELERQVKIAMERNASNAASELLERIQTVNGIPLITHNLGDADGEFLQAIADALKGRFKGIVVLGGASNGAVALVATVSPDFTSKAQAGKIIQAIAPVVGGKGGGKPDNARGGGKDATKLEEALAKVKTLI